MALGDCCCDGDRILMHSWNSSSETHECAPRSRIWYCGGESELLYISNLRVRTKLWSLLWFWRYNLNYYDFTILGIRERLRWNGFVRRCNELPFVNALKLRIVSWDQFDDAMHYLMAKQVVLFKVSFRNINVSGTCSLMLNKVNAHLSSYHFLNIHALIQILLF